MVSKLTTARLYPEEGIEEFDEIRPVNTETQNIETNNLALLLRLPESDQVRSNVRRVTIVRPIGSIASEFLDIQVGGLLVSNPMTFDHKRSGNLG